MQRIAQCLLAGCLAIAAPLCLAAGAPGTDNEGTPTFRSEVHEVRLAFAASDRNGKSVHNLAPEDVAVVDEERIVRHFRSFSTAAESPLKLIILLDASGSLEKGFAAEIAAVREFIAQTPWGGRDRVAILTFGGTSPELLCARNCAAPDGQRKMEQLRAGGLTPLYDALVTAVDIVRQQDDPEYRSALLVFSDGMDTISRYSLGDAATAAQDLQLPVYSVNPCRRGCAGEEGGAVLQALAERTGGLYLGSGKSPQEFLRAVIADLHSGYVVTYQLPPAPAARHVVRVVATRQPGLQFRSRSTYRSRGEDGEE